MTDIRRYDTGSDMLDSIIAERKRIRKDWCTPKITAPKQILVPPLPTSKPKSVEERVAEVEAFRGILPDHSIVKMRAVIRQSEVDCSKLEVSCVPHEKSIDRIQYVVEEHFGITRDEMLSCKRNAEIVISRQISMYLARILTTFSFPQIARYFSGRDHTTVMYSVKKIQRMIAADAEFAKRIETLKRCCAHEP